MEDVWEQWVEQDLLESARHDKLEPAFEVDHWIDSIADICAAGKSPILVGQSGVGKTAIVAELARQLVNPTRQETRALAERLKPSRILQVSFKRRAVSLKKPDEEIGEKLQELVEALVADGSIIPYFRDIHLAYRFDVETLLESLAFRLPQPILGEGQTKVVRNMLEYQSDLEKHFVTLEVPEPDMESTSAILKSWCDVHSTKEVDDGARMQALHLSHRFLSRSRMPRKVLDLMSQVIATSGGRKVTAKAVIERFSDIHRVPQNLIDPSISLDLGQLTDHFQSNLLGQGQAVRTVVDVIGMIKAGLSDPRRPFGVFLFAGPTGVGKTHLAQLLAEYLFGSRERMIRINMTDFAGEGGANKLFGHPHANGISRQRGVLTSRVSGTPFAVLLLDEFEKAHPEVYDRLLQLIDEGEFMNGLHETVSCRSMIIIATSNAGAEVYRQESFGFRSRASDIESKAADVERRLHELFRFEFLNRFDRIVHFYPLKRDSIRQIALRELRLLEQRSGLHHRNLTLSIDDSVLDWLATHGYHPNFGARFLRRVIERNLASCVAGAIVRENPNDGSEIAVTVRGKNIAAYVGTEPKPELEKASFVKEGKTLTREQLIGRSEELLKSVAPLLTALDALRDKRSKALQAMAEPGVWQSADRRSKLLEEFQDYDMRVRMQAAGAEAATLLKDSLDSDIPTERLARRYERATREKDKWELRLAEAGSSSVWLVVGAVDAMRDTSEYIKQLVMAELSWCERLSLQASVVAYSENDGRLERVYIEAEGPGAAAFLTHEQGVHRFHVESRTYKVALGVHEQLPGSKVAVRSKRRRAGLFNLDVDGEFIVEIPEHGIKRVVSGCRDERLGELAAIAKELTVPLEPVVRVYGADGVGARDPETGVVLSRYKDAQRGYFDRFLEARRFNERREQCA